tara:strand:- start:6990 stop:7439 length:450 start_codon:yes stop_codon:yes gene_type:complete
MKHNYTIAQIIFGWIIYWSFIFGSYYAGQWTASDDHEDELERIVDWNTKQIHSLGIAAATDSYNADLMIQILNLMEGREVKPPSRSAISGMLLSEDVIEDDDVPHTFEQIEKDQREVDQSIRAFASSNLFQAETLENILNKLQGGNYLQ